MGRTVLCFVFTALVWAGVALATDEVPPPAITDLTVDAGAHNVLVHYTEPVDQCSNAMVAEIDIRIADHTITNLNFGTQNILGSPVPAGAGRRCDNSADFQPPLQLNCDITYHLAIKTKDSAGNWSSISNEVVFTMAPCNSNPITCK